MPTILIVDDHEHLRTVLGRMLAVSYPRTWAFSRAEDAIERIRWMTRSELSEALVLMDVSLRPEDQYPDGCEASRVIARRFSGLRVVIMSGHDYREWRDFCRGNPPWLEKPIKLDDLLGAIEALLWAPPWTPPEERPEEHRRARD